MYQIIRGSESGNVGIKIEKRLTPDDYELLIPYIDKLRQKGGSMCVLCDMSQCEDQTNNALWRDLVDQLQHVYDIPKVAVVGVKQSTNESSITECPPTSNTTVKYFAVTQLDSAWHWVEETET